MSTTNPTQTGLLGQLVHVRQDGVTVRMGTNFMASARVLRRGDEFEITDAVLEAGLDRNGALPSWTKTLDDPSGPVGRGPWPNYESKYVRGTPEWAEAREIARQRAWRLAGRDEQAEALRQVERDFGDALPTHRVISRTRGEGEPPLTR